MKLPATKLIIQLTIVLLLAVILFILSISIYSIRYWPDVYNYINANITIKRIPTLTELNITYYAETTDFATTDYIDTTVEYDTKDYFSLDEVETQRDRRRVKIENDYAQPSGGIIDYFFEIETSTKVMTDLMDEDKLTTNMADVEIMHGGSFATKYLSTMYNASCPQGTSEDNSTVLSWIVAIFVKNGTNQFQYYCDGALLSSNIIITAARCVNSTDDEDIVVILGKTSLQDMRETEKIIKITEVIVHENFTDSKDDIALLKTEDAIETTKSISIACLSNGDEFTNAMTTGWAVSGGLTAINFVKEKSQQCTTPQDICGVYGNDITVCPSYGGVYAVKQGGWYLHGIRNADPTDRGLCINKPLHYTPLNQYADWINYNL